MIQPTYTPWCLRLARATLLVLLAVGLPLFICMPLYQDVSWFDIAARNLLQGGIHYRDIADSNLPGMVWLHVGIRSVLGWKSETLRLIDFLIVTLILALLMLWLRRLGLTPAGRVWTAVVLIAFYLATSEVCHCQRDVWMLLPALAALTLRGRRIASMRARGGALGPITAQATAEGLCWGIAFWIKPFVAVPALICWVVTACIFLRTPDRDRRMLAADAAALVAGGLLVIGAGVAWLRLSGTWPFFQEAMSWNAGYYRGPSNGIIRRTTLLLQQGLPWSWVHVLAIPIALSALWRALAVKAVSGEQNSRSEEALLAGFYLGWLLQANYVQWGFLYHIAPATLLAIAVIAGRRWLPGRSALGWIVLTGFLAMAAARHPLTDMGRTALWVRCWREGSSPALQNRLALNPEAIRPDWVALDRIATFLKNQRLRDKELTCYSFGTSVLYLRLGLIPSTRFMDIHESVYQYPSSQNTIRAELAASPERYIVSDISYLAAQVRVADLVEEQNTGPAKGALSLSPEVPASVRAQYPWSEPIVFRAGQYVVHRSAGSLRHWGPPVPR